MCYYTIGLSAILAICLGKIPLCSTASLPAISRGDPEQFSVVLIDIFHLHIGHSIRNGILVPQHMLKGFY